MGQLGRFVRFWFGIQAIGLVGSIPSAVLIVFFLNRDGRFNGYSAGDFPGGIALWAVVSVAVDILPAIAWWTLKKGKRSARGWAIAASLASFPVPFPGRSLLRIIPQAFGIVGFLAGIAGLIAFSQSQVAAEVADSARVKPKRLPGDGTSKLADIVAAVIGLGGLWLTYVWWSRWGREHDLPRTGFFLEILLLQLAIVIAVIGHEFGHIAGGWIAGMKLRHVRVGPFLWSIRDGAWRFRLDPAHLLDGAVSMASPNFSDTRGKAVMILGGPVGSFLTAGLAGIAALSAPGQTWAPSWSLFAMISSIALVGFVVNMIPQAPEAHYSDGAQFYQLMTKGPWATVHLAFAMVGATLVGPTRPRDWDVDLLHRAAEFIRAGERAVMLRMYLCMYYLETGRIREAAVSLEEAERLFDGANLKEPAACCLEFAFFNAVCKRDRARVEHWWERWEAMDKKDRNIEYWAALASVKWLQGELEAAHDALEQGKAASLMLPAAGAYEFDRWRFECLREAMSTTTSVGR